MRKELGQTLKELRLERKLNQGAVADVLGIDDANISRCESGHQVLEFNRLLKLADFYGVALSDIFAMAEGRKPINKHREEGLDVPLLNATGSMGEGDEQPGAEMVVDVLRLKKDWINENLRGVSSTSNLSFIHALGDSMTPTIMSGDILLVDTGIRNIPVDGVYVLAAHERIYIKRVRQRMDGKYEISSDNPTVKTVDELNGDHEVDVLGRALWVWNGRRL